MRGQKLERRAEIYRLQHGLVGDSRQREREMKRLLSLVREDAVEKAFTEAAAIRARAEQRS
jgi:hypothetical protein